VIAALHRLKQDEEGQALVLGAIFGLILALCVLTTVGLGRAVYDKVQLQTAADAAAYSQAAVEARVLNFTAYTNRAMVVHYASIMAASAYLTWIHFLWAGIHPLLEVLTIVPFVGEIAAAIDEIVQVLMTALDWAVAGLTPVLAAANTVLWGLQEGAWAAAMARLGKIAPEAHSGDSSQAPYEAIWPELTAAANIGTLSKTRGHAFPGENIAKTSEILLNAKDDEVQLARATMLEIANSARQPWVAYGDRWGNPSWILFNRHARLWLPLLCSVDILNVARTELGSPPGGTTQGARGQVFSASALKFNLDCPWPLPSGKVRIFQLATMDQVFPALSPGADYDVKGIQASGAMGKLLKLILGGAAKVMEVIAEQTAPSPSQRFFWISPYVSFAPQARSTPEGVFGNLGNFAQPDVIVGLAKEGRHMNSENGMDKIQARKFASTIGGSASADLSYTDADTPSIANIPAMQLHKGLNAFAAAQAYYHRPGDWRETPNFFNPLWGARLMPIVESNAANLVPHVVDNSFVKRFLLH
jgi:Putative Flp pilus-assembly TadE/G-like